MQTIILDDPLFLKKKAAPAHGAAAPVFADAAALGRTHSPWDPSTTTRFFCLPVNTALSPLAQRVCFVLVEPSHPGNIGSAARAVKTMGFTDLRVVAPRVPGYRTHPDAVALSTTSVDVLERSRDFATLTEALEDAALAFAMTGYSREFGPPLETIRESADRAAMWLETPENKAMKCAFVFGCERSGLTNEDVERCQFCSAIPANPQSQSLNLAQSVQIAAYEMHLALLSAGHAESLYAWQERFAHEPAAGVAAIEGFLEHWQQAMIACGALNPAEPKNLMEMSRRLFSRAGLTQPEVDLLRGICAAVILPRHLRAGSKKGAGKGTADSQRPQD